VRTALPSLELLLGSENDNSADRSTSQTECGGSTIAGGNWWSRLRLRFARAAVSSQGLGLSPTVSECGKPRRGSKLDCWVCISDGATDQAVRPAGLPHLIGSAIPHFLRSGL